MRADVAGGAWSSDFGARLLRGLDRQIGCTERLAAAVRDKRPPSSRDHTLRDLFAQRLSQMASGDADGHEAHRLRDDPMFPRRLARVPRDPTQALARAPTCSRLAHRVTRTALSRLPHAFVAPCMARSPEPPAAIVLDREHAADPPQGPQALPCYHHHDQRSGDLPRLLCAGPSPALVTACLRPGKRPPGMEKALLLVRLLSSLRRPWPSTPLLVRGARHFATPEGMEGVAPRRQTACGFGCAGNAGLRRHAAPGRQDARALCRQPPAHARA